MYLSRIYPDPRSVRENEDLRFSFGAHVTASVSGLNQAERERVKTLWYRFSCDASRLEITEGGIGFSFRVGSACCTLNPGDTYALQTGPEGICVQGKDARSLLDGIKTLVQLICPLSLSPGSESLYMSAAHIHDAPAMPFRAVHFCVFPGTRIFDMEQSIHMAGFLKMSHVILEYWGTFPYECMPQMYWKDRVLKKSDLQALVQLANSYGMEVIPMINHFGHATQSRGLHGRHVTLNQDPRLSLLFEPDGWTWCLSNPDTYKLLSDMRLEQEALAGSGSYFHLGFDEADSFATCPVCRSRVPHELLAEYVNRLTEDVCSRNRRPILWHDMFIRRSDFPADCFVEANGGHKNTHLALDLLDRRLIMADWNYNYTNGFNPTTAYFIGRGFDTVICPWDGRDNVSSISADVKKYGAMGMIITTWHHLPGFLRDSAFMGNCAWSAGEKAWGAQYSEGACLLRRLCDARGEFERSGWSVCEAER